MNASTFGCQLRGLEGSLVEVQVAVAAAARVAVAVVGLPGAGVKEAVTRVRSALAASGLRFPSDRRVTINMAPAEIRKEGTGFDLPMAAAIALAVAGIEAPAGLALIGELGLDGSVRNVPGILPAVAALRRAGISAVVVPAEAAAEAALVAGIEVLPAATLREVFLHLSGAEPLPVRPHSIPAPATPDLGPGADDLCEVQGQEAARRALEIAAAGGHNLLLTGPPGAGKTMLARCLPGILPPLEVEAALEVVQVRSILGELTSSADPLHWARPFRAPHHSISTAGLVGGGAGVGRPGEITRADHGVLFLDELAEFSPATLQTLRQPLETGRAEITRSLGSVTYPARFQLVAATNPCPCGWHGDDRRACRCPARSIDAYRRALSGPLLDRIDLRVAVGRPPLTALGGEPGAESSASVRERVILARQVQATRQGDVNARLRGAALRRHAALGRSRAVLERWAGEGGLTARGFHRAWRVARTIADLEGCEGIAEKHVLEALGYRLEVGLAAA